MKQTAVEWLIEQLKENNMLTFDEWTELVDQAKAMEKEHKIEFADEYGDYLLNGGMMSANSYMETFKSE